MKLRSSAGPRDWTPAADSGISPKRLPSSPPTHERSAHKLRGIGVLALLLSFGALIGALSMWQRQSPQNLGFTFPGLGLLTAYIALHTSGLSRGAYDFARIAAVVGVIAMLIVGLSYARPLWEPQVSIPLQPSVPIAPVGPVLPIVDDLPPELQLVQIAGTVAFLLDHQCPDVLQASSTGLIVMPKGSLQLPADGHVSFTRQAEGCAVTISRPDGSYATWDSISDQVTSG